MCRILKAICRMCCCCCVGAQKDKRPKRQRHKRSDRQTSKTQITNSPQKDLRVSTTQSMATISRIIPALNYGDETKERDNWTTAFDNCVMSRVGFNTEKRIGFGGYGVVWRARDVKNDRMVAIKAMKLSEKKQMVNVFKNEVFTLYRCQHKHIIQLISHYVYHNSEDVPTVSYMVMELAEEDLETRLKRTANGFDESTARHYFYQISNGLHFLHSRGMAHEDLKLTNILIVKSTAGQEVIKLTDFGCAHVVWKNDRLVKNKSAVGTPHYMAPEALRVMITQDLRQPQLFKHRAEVYNPAKDDCWALGVCLYKLLFGSHPYEFPYNKLSFEAIDQIKANALYKTVMYWKQTQYIKGKCLEKLSYHCVDLLQGLLNYDADARIVHYVLPHHLWITEYADFVATDWGLDPPKSQTQTDVKTDNANDKKVDA